MSTPITEFPEPEYNDASRNRQPENNQNQNQSQNQSQIQNHGSVHTQRDSQDNGQSQNGAMSGSTAGDAPLKRPESNLTVNVRHPTDDGMFLAQPSPSRSREESHRLDDDLAMLQVQREVSHTQSRDANGNEKLARSVSRNSRQAAPEPVDEFDAATTPLHNQTVYKPPEDPTTSFARFFKKVHESSFLVRYFTYIVPLVLLLLIPLLVGALAFPDAHVGGVELTWFAVWLEIVWLSLWAGRIAAKFIPRPFGVVASLFTNSSKKWRDMAHQLELPAALFFWWLAIEVSFLPIMTNRHIDGDTATRHWEVVVNKIIIGFLVFFTLNFVEKILIQLIAISFHLRTYADRIEINKFQIGSLTKLYAHSGDDGSFDDEDEDSANGSGANTRNSGNKTPMQLANQAQKAAREALNKVGDVAGTVAGDFTGKNVVKSNHPHQVVITLLRSAEGSQVLARRLYRTYVRDGFETVFPGDLKSAFEDGEEAEAAFSMFDKDLNGDISMEELEAVCVEIGRERKSITASLKDLDSVVGKLNDVFVFIVFVIALLVFLSLISASTAGVLTSAGSTLLALSWLFSASAQELLASVIFVFIKHPFDVGDRVSIYGNTGDTGMGDDYYVKEIALLYTEFKKLQGHVVQAPNSYLNTLFILNQRRSGALAEAVPTILKFGTTMEQIDALRQSLLEFVKSEKREYQGNILTELRDVTEAYSITLNVVFFYKSNWQNELLRLQRRNKFICNMMVSIQELGIEGPRANLQGAAGSIPYHVTYQAPPQYTAHADDPSNPPPPHAGSDRPADPEARDRLGELSSPGAATSGAQAHPSILRNRSGTTSSVNRAPGSQTRKNVDFSLGMRNMSSADMISDVYEQRGSPSRVGAVMRNANMAASENRRREQEQARGSSDQQGSTSGTGAAGRGRGGSMESGRTGASNATRPSGGSLNRSNRFFGRLGSRNQGNEDAASSNGPSSARGAGRGGADDDLMEQGRFGHGAAPTLPHPSGDGEDRPLTTWSSEPRRSSLSMAQRERSREEAMEMSNYPRPQQPQ